MKCYLDQEILSLFNAVNSGSIEHVRQAFSVIECSGDVSEKMTQTNDHGLTVMHVAAIQGRLDIIELFFSYSASLLTQQTIDGLSPLHCAVAAGHVECIRCIHSLGGDVVLSQSMTNGFSAVHMAVHFNQLNSLDCLTALGCEVFENNDHDRCLWNALVPTMSFRIKEFLAKLQAEIILEEGYIRTQCRESDVEGMLDNIPLTIDVESNLGRLMSPGSVASRLIAYKRVMQEGSVNKTKLLWHAVRTQELSAVQFLINTGIVDLSDCLVLSKGCSILHEAISRSAESECCRIIEELLRIDHNRQLVSAGDHGWRPLHQAAQDGHSRAIGLLLAAGGEKHATTIDKYPPLMFALLNNKEDCVARLAFCPKNIQEMLYIIAVPIEKNCRGAVKAFCEYLKKELDDDNLKKLLHISLIINILKPWSFDLDEKPQSCLDYLIGFCLEENLIQNINSIIPVIKRLASFEKLSPLAFSAKNGYVDIIALLFSSSSNVRSVEIEEALKFALARGHSEVVSLISDLIHRKLRDSRQNKEEALCFLIRRGYINILSYLLDEPNFDLNNMDRGVVWNLLNAAVTNHRTEVLRLLLDRGAEVLSATSHSWTLLMQKTFENNECEVLALLKAGSNVNLRAEDQSTPIHIAQYKRHYSIIYLLHHYGADINSQKEDGWTPLLGAVQEGDLSGVSLLLQLGADPNLSSDQDVTPLHIAAHIGHDKIVRLLLKSGSDAYCQAENGRTPLNFAEEGGHDLIVRLLLETGAYFNQPAESKTVSTVLESALVDKASGSIKSEERLTLLANIFPVQPSERKEEQGLDQGLYQECML